MPSDLWWLRVGDVSTPLPWPWNLRLFSFKARSSSSTSRPRCFSLWSSYRAAEAEKTSSLARRNEDLGKITLPPTAAEKRSFSELFLGQRFCNDIAESNLQMREETKHIRDAQRNQMGVGLCFQQSICPIVSHCGGRGVCILAWNLQCENPFIKPQRLAMQNPICPFN